MKLFSLSILCIFLLNSCRNQSKESKHSEGQIENVSYASYGNNIIPDDAIASSSMANHYKTMNVGDSIPLKMTAKVNAVCQAKGCWMTLNLEDGNEVMVKFKDYGFFVPKDIVGKEVIVNGKAFVNEVPVNEQRHYAEDAGKSPEEIANIIAPKRTYSFEANGVLVKQ